MTSLTALPLFLLWKRGNTVCGDKVYQFVWKRLFRWMKSGKSVCGGKATGGIRVGRLFFHACGFSLGG